MIDSESGVAFIGVNLIPMDAERVIADQTVLVRNGLIAAIGPASDVEVSVDVIQVEGEGLYLMPGLAEMHGHIPAPDEPRQLTEDVLFLYVANGVTTVRGMQGAVGQLDLRDEVNNGEIVGPNLYLAGPRFSGNAVRTPEEAIQRVNDQRAEGWHLLKVSGGLDVETYDAMSQTARENEIRFGGHVPADVGLVHAINEGQETFDHLDGYEVYLTDESGSLDERRLESIVIQTREAGAWAVPTMALWEVLRGTIDLDELRNYSETQYMPIEIVEQWINRVESVQSAVSFDQTSADQVIANRMQILKALHDGGVGLLLGTDAPQVFSVPGFSIHREMERMVAAGMTPYEVIVTGTRNVGDYFRNEDAFGIIEVGARADLILVDENPLADVGNIASRAGVMVSGNWYSEVYIQERLARISASN